MGVRGLTTYINSNKDAFLQHCLLHDINLIVDGHSLCAQLYRLINSFSAFGGDYDKYASYTRNFFKNLRKCNICPYVLFDGSYESRKLRTAYSRLRSKISGASRLDPVTQDSLQIFPLLLRDVFKEVLLDINVPFTICEFEADDEIAAMARHLKCPVLSYDSDFFIYNVLYIPFNTLEFKPKPYVVDGNKFFALECKIYKVEFMLKNLGGLREEMLPLLATLLGNDFVEKRVFNKFFSQLKIPKSKSLKNDQQRCIHGLLKWLQNETLDTAIAKILGRLKKNQKDKVFAIIKKSINGYNKTLCRSLQYFNISHDIEEDRIEIQMPIEMEDETAEEKENNDSNTDESCDDDNNSEIDVSEESSNENQDILGIPDWFADGIRNRSIPHSYINLYTHHLHFCSPQAEDYTDEDSFLCTLPILRYAFDILTDFSFDYCIYVSRENDCSYKRILVNDEYAIPRIFEIPFCELSKEEKRLYFNNFVVQKMGVLDKTLLETLPINFQLYMMSILWWIAKCDVQLGNLHSLFLTYIMLEVIDEKTGTFRGSNFFNNKYSKKVEELKRQPPLPTSVDDELFLNKNKVQYEDCLIAASVLLKHFEIDNSIKKKPKSYDTKRMHSFAQFQCCLQQFNCLNSLCGSPFESTKYSKCYSGTFVYNIALKLENQVDPVNFIELYLKGATTVLMFYKSLCIIYEKFAQILSLKTSKWCGNVKKRRRKKKIDHDIDFIVKGFESEVFI